ncbi:MAG TPA: hypothetical protein VGS62_10780 [Streptosporangiaceae bacterium]|nr:hypothetical protein [Streptosporangiaceae bacterium]
MTTVTSPSAVSPATETPAAVYHRVMNTEWPPSREARWAIGWAAATLRDAMSEGADDEELADLAAALEKRLAEYRRRGTAGLAGTERRAS